MLVVVLNDIADQDHDEELLETLLNAIFIREIDTSWLDEAGRLKLAFTLELWDTIFDRALQLPHYEALKDLFVFDYRQLFNCLRYAILVNRDPSRLNQLEHDIYNSHNMHMMISFTLDLMATPGFDRRELGLLRKAAWQAECMGRIGNAVTTWQREILDLDFTSDVWPLALERGLVDLDELASTDPTTLERRLRASKIEYALLAAWAYRRACLIELAQQIRSVDVLAYVQALEKLLHLHLISRGYK